MEIRCKKCNRCLSKGAEVGTGFFYLNPDKELVLFKEEIKCPNCGILNEISVKVGVRITVRELTLTTGNVTLTGKNNLYSA